ncbi:MAG TPA: hypothetical protein VF575_05630 [Candidatus Saccharimonadales bacterium]|jgi:hypothetical protein
MNKKHNHIKLNRYTIGTLVILTVLVASSAGVMIKNNRAQASPAVNQAVPRNVQSQFTFNGAADWRQGPTRLKDMALFHDIQDSCFTSMQRKTGSVAADKTEHDKTNADLIRDGRAVTPGNAVSVTLQTNDGLKSYQLQQFMITTPPGGEKLLGGMEYGYLPLSENDYILIEGHCETYEQLAATIPALQAITFDASQGAASN